MSLLLQRIICSSDDLLSLSAFFSDRKGTFLLHSAGNFNSSETSFLFLFPLETFQVDQKRGSWEALKGKLGSLRQESALPEWVGFLSYELGEESDPDKRILSNETVLPKAYFQKCALLCVWKEGTLSLYAAEDITALSSEEKNWIDDFSRPSFLQKIKSLKEKGKGSWRLSQPLVSFSAYKEKIDAIKELIFEGEVYQVNLSHAVHVQGSQDPFSLFLELIRANPAPFMAYFQGKDYTLISSSPERLLQKKGKRLSTCPIKGTIPRGRSPEEDERRKKELLFSEKERAELLMITDLSRNDLAKASKKGSVSVERLFFIEEYTNVFHMLSEISSHAKEEIHPVDILRSVFPGGSITGCPKIRAQEVIREIEGEARGIYTGSIGYLCANGDFDFNIAIRTLFLQGEKGVFRLGGAVVIDSDPKKEYEETLHKGKTLFRRWAFDVRVVEWKDPARRRSEDLYAG